MKKATLFIMMAIVLLSACQPAPEKEIVINKNSSNISESNNETKSPIIELDIPTEWKDELIVSSNVTFNIDATVETPNIKKYPIVSVEPTTFTEEQIKNVFEVLVGEKPLYNDTRFTKSELIEQLVQFKANIANGKSEMSDEENQQQIEILEEAIRNAPEKINTTLSEIDFGSEYLNIRVDFDNSKGYININNPKESPRDAAIYFNNGIGAPITLYSPIIQGDISITQNESLTMAKELLSNLGINDMSLSKITPGTLSASEKHDAENNSNYCYILYFTRSTNGMIVGTDFTPMSGMGPKDGASIYSQPWKKEQIIISVNKNGIIDFVWEGNSKDVNIVNDNAELLKFEDIAQIFKKQVKIQFSWAESQNSKSLFNIKIAKLNYMRVPKKDSPDEYLFIPVWDFYGDSVYDENGKENKVHDREFASYITINAIDGSIIDRSLGY